MRNIKRFILLTLLAAAPALAFLATYAWLDPFCTLWRNPLLSSQPQLVNRSVMSTEVFCRNSPTRHYDSFIFGSSISGYFSVDEWKKHLPHNSSVMHFDASSETLQGIAQKIDFIASRGEKLRNALIIVDYAMLYRSQDTQDHLYAPDPRLTSQAYWFKFQYIHFTAFRQIKFLKKYFIADELTPLIPTAPLNHITNECDYSALEAYVESHSDTYYTPALLHKFEIYAPLRPTPQPVFSESNRHWIKQIAEKLKLLGTNYIVIVVPAYRCAPADCISIDLMRTCFGEEKVFDYTHDSWLKDDPRHYYDPLSHMRITYCNKMLNDAYTKRHPGKLFPSLSQP